MFDSTELESDIILSSTTRTSQVVSMLQLRTPIW